jgi:two-component system, chemotaxis family, chemotaxis protein CheY
MARILVVDDVDVVRLVISKILKRAGHSVEEANSGDQALARVTRRAPDAVVTDLWMPGSDGLGLINTLQANFPAVAILAMTGGSPKYSQESSLEQARRAGVVQILMKPIDKVELVDAVDRALSAAGGRQGNPDSSLKASTTPTST